MGSPISFLPEDYLEKKSQQRTNILCLFLFLVVVGGLGVAFFMNQKRSQKIKDKAGLVNQEMALAGESLRQLDLLESKRQAMAEKASISAMLMETVPRTLLLATITNDLPIGVSLLEYSMESKEVVQKQRNENNKSKSKNKKLNKKASAPAQEESAPKKWKTELQFTGVAPTDQEVSQLIANLSQCRLFDQINLVYTEEYKMEEDTMRRFELEAVLAQDARASKEDVEKTRRQHVRGL